MIERRTQNDILFPNIKEEFAHVFFKKWVYVSNHYSIYILLESIVYLKVIVLFAMSILAILLKVLHLQLSQFMIKFLIWGLNCEGR